MPVVGFYESYDHVIRYSWKNQRQFLGIVEPYLDDLASNWEQEMNRQAQHIEDAEYRRIFYESHEDIYDEFQQYQVILLNSFFTASFALFERQLMMLCSFAKQSSGTPCSVRDLGSRDYTNNAKVYLKRLGVNFPSDKLEWSRIRTYQRIRNKVMHGGGYINHDWKYFSDAKNIGVISGHGSEQVKLTRSICEEAVNNFEKILMMVHKAVGDLKV